MRARHLQPLGGEGAVMAALMLRWDAVVLSTLAFTLEPDGVREEMCHVFRMPSSQPTV